MKNFGAGLPEAETLLVRHHKHQGASALSTTECRSFGRNGLPMNLACRGSSSHEMCPDIKTTAALGHILVMRFTSSGPHISGIMTSDTSKSKHGVALANSSACKGLDTALTS
jgi:hypothetical protein